MSGEGGSYSCDDDRVMKSCTVKKFLISSATAATVVGLLEKAHTLSLLYARLPKFPF